MNEIKKFFDDVTQHALALTDDPRGIGVKIDGNAPGSSDLGDSEFRRSGQYDRGGDACHRQILG